MTKESGAQVSEATLQEVVSLLERNKGKGLNEDKLVSYLNSPQLKSMIQIHNTTLALSQSKQAATTQNAVTLLNDFINESLASKSGAQVKELQALLSSPHILGLFYAHDRVANEDYSQSTASKVKLHLAPSASAGSARGSMAISEAQAAQIATAAAANIAAKNAAASAASQTPAATPAATATATATASSSPPSSRAADRASNPGIKVARIEKVPGVAFGATVAQVNNHIYVARVMVGGVASQSGLLASGDEILSVNDQDVTGKTVEQVVAMIKAATGVVVFKLRPASVETSEPKPMTSSVKKTVMALFDYYPEKDELAPCLDAMVSFRKRDIIEVLNLEDDMWWQVRRFGTDKVGLIPSPTIQAQRKDRILAVRKSKANDATKEDDKKKKSNDKSKSTQGATSGKDEEYVNIGRYVTVVKRNPDPHVPRPLVLVGADGIGKSDLRKTLLSENSSLMSTVVPHTSRAKRDNEQEGREYHFTSKEVMAKDIADGKYLEHGEFKENFYGTHIDSISTLSKAGKVVLLEVHPHALPRLGLIQPLPFVLFVKPGDLDTLKKKNPDVDKSKLQEVYAASEKIEKAYSQFFEASIVNDDKSGEPVKKIIASLSKDPYWSFVKD